MRPIWLNDDILQEVLQKHFQENPLEILDVSCEPVVPIGENYTSDLYRVHIKSEFSSGAKTTSFIVKCTQDAQVMGELSKQMQLFEKEIHMFTKVLPKAKEMLKGRGFTSNCYYTSGEKRSILIFEDLKELNYTMKNRHEGLDLEHCLKAMEKLAQLHAASATMIQEDEAFVTEAFDMGIFSELDSIQAWIRLGFQELSKSCKEWHGVENLGEKLGRLGDEAILRIMEASARRPSGFNVINHGDFWTNNMMFLYGENGNLEDIKLVDFQFCKYSSPALDLQYFWATTPNEEVLRSGLETILNFYCERLIHYLEEFGFSGREIPSEASIKEEFVSRAFYGLCCAATATALIKSDHRSDASFENLMTHQHEDSFRFNCYHNLRYQTLMEQLLPYYDKLGILDS